MHFLHDFPRGGAGARDPSHSCRHHATSGKLRIFVGSRDGYSRLCLPAQGHRGFLDSQRRPPRSDSLREVLRAECRDHHALLSPNTNPNEAAPNPLAFGNATWQSSLDSSKVWAQTVHSIVAGSDASCPNDGAIGCLLLQSIGSQQGPTGGKGMIKTTFIQRLNTKGGSAPADGCSTSADVGSQTLVPYTADYYFFRKNQ
jgi:hypothetical protein